MKSVFIAFFAAAIAVAITAPSFANEMYYIELGGDMTQQTAGQQWHELIQKHKRLLGHLNYYPKTVMQGGSQIATRIQAGPIESKTGADKVCARLFADKIPCFVIEGSNGAPPGAVISLSERAEAMPQAEASLPWLAPARTNPAFIENTGPSPRIEESSLPEPVMLKSPPKLPSGRHAKVEVAEAIRVPVSEDNASESIAVSDAPEVKPVSAQSRGDKGTGWLNIESFGDQDSAMAFWEQVRAAMPEKTAGLRMRTISPLRNEGQTVVNIGPFANHADAHAFCRDAIKTRDRNLQCIFDNNEALPGSDEQTLVPRYAHADAYAARRRMIALGHHAATGGAYAPAEKAAKIYWVQVLSAPSEMEALEAWEDLRNTNSDLLEKARSSVSASLTDKSSYVVRVGPLTDNDKAIGLCTALRDRGVDCRVLLYDNR